MQDDGECLDDLSRQLCRFVAGEDRLLSAVCWERRWRGLFWFALRLIVDAHFYQRRGERHHCRSAARREGGNRAAPDRLRFAGL